MRILFVTPYVPSLIRVRPFNFIKQLSRRHEMVLVCLVQGEKDAAAVDSVREYCEKVYDFPLSKVRSLTNCCKRILGRMPLQAAYTDLPYARDFINRMTRSIQFDILHVEHIRGAHLTDGVEGVPKVFDSVDCITRLLKLRLARERGALQRALGYEELLKMRSYEPKIAAEFDGVVITSEHDKRALEYLIRHFVVENKESVDQMDQRRLVRSLIESYQDARLNALSAESSQVAVVGNGVDSDYFHPMPERVRAGTVVFSGKMSYFPNISAVLNFYREVLPRIRLVRPDVRFKIVGSDPPDAVRRLEKDPAVEVTGYLKDIRPDLASAEVVVCPLTVGVGIQNKVLEAMSMGKPVVASPIASSGIPEAVDGQELICADEPSQMADAVLRILNDPQQRQRIGENARRFVQERYSWDAATRELEIVHARTVDTYRERVLDAA